MVLNVQEFAAQLQFGGARPTLFQVIINNPVNAAGDLKTPFMVKASQLPGSTLGQVEVPYMGRKLKIAGDRTFEEWTATIINDEDFLIRNAMEQWMNAINTHATNQREFGSASPLLYKTQAVVSQLSKTGVTLREYTFSGLWPTNVAPIELGWEQNDTIEEYQVTFAYDYWEVTGGVTGKSTS